MPQIKGFELVGEFIGDDFGRGTECNDEDCALGLFAGFFDDQIAFFKGIFGRANDSFDAGCVVEKIVSDSETGKFPFRKLFKTPISERWGKQICLNE